MRNLFAAAAFAFAVALAACGGGGSSSHIVPGTGSNAPGGGSGSTSSGTHAKMTVKIPSAGQQHAKRPFYVSSSTESFAIEAIPAGSTQTPSPVNAQIFPVATPSPCSSQSGGYVCTFNVQVPYGEDVFYVAAFAQASPGPSSSPIANYISNGPVDIVAGASPPSLTFVMNAVAQTVTVNVTPDPQNAADTLVFPIASPNSAGISVNAFDANGDSILSDETTPFAVPIPISISPISQGLTLVQNTPSVCTGSALSAVGANGESASIVCPGDMASFSVAYDGTTHPDSSDHAIDTFTVADTAQPSPSPTPATILLSSNVVSFPVGNIGEDIESGLMTGVGSNQFVYVLQSYDNSYAGSFSGSTGTASSPAVMNGVGSPVSLAADSTGTSWIVDTSEQTLDCWNSSTGLASGNAPDESFSPMYGGQDPMQLFAVAVDQAHDVWFAAEDDATGQDYLGEFNDAGGCSVPAPTSYAFVTLNNEIDYYENVNTLAAIPNHNGVAFNSQSNGMFTATTVDLGGTVSAVPGLNSGWQSLSGAVATDATGTAYAMFSSQTGTSADLESFLSGAASAVLPSAISNSGDGGYTYPAFLSVFSPTNGAANRAIYSEQDWAALGEVTFGSPVLTELVALPASQFSEATAYGPNGQQYVLSQQTTQNIVIDRVINTKTWSVPATVGVEAGCDSSQAIVSVNERIDSGPFTVTGVTSSAFSGTDPHDFLITLPNPPPAPVTFTISTATRSQTVTLPTSQLECGG